MAERPVGVDVIYLLSGPMAAGKTTVARALAARFDRSVHLEGDVFRRSIVRGRLDMTPQASAAARAQLQLRYRLLAHSADTYAEAGFTVVAEDVVGPAYLGELRTAIMSRPCHVVVLMPSRQAVAAREARRRHKGYRRWTVDELYDLFEHEEPRTGLWVDSSEQTPEETADEILARTASGRVPIVVVDHDPQWATQFAAIEAVVLPAVSDLGARLEHVGSTAVPGLAAKPIVDVDVVVPDADRVQPAIARLRTLGYLHQGDKGVAGREAFLWPPHLPRHHLYVVVDGSEPLRNHLRFRDHLRRSPAAADAYGRLKRDLAARFGDDGVAYTDAKTAFVMAALDAAR